MTIRQVPASTVFICDGCGREATTLGGLPEAWSSVLHNLHVGKFETTMHLCRTCGKVVEKKLESALDWLAARGVREEKS